MKIAFFSSDQAAAQDARQALEKKYGSASVNDADVVVALGGDGTLLHCVHEHLRLNKPFFGMNLGSVGFLLNSYRDASLPERIAAAQAVTLYPLRMNALFAGGQAKTALAINEVSLLRETAQTAKLGVSIDGVTRMEELMCDGVIVSTPAGSTAYNFSAHGPILPLTSNLLALTPISAFRPRRWRGALLPHEARIVFSVLEAEKRPVSAVADFIEFRDVTEVEIFEDRGQSFRLLYDPELNLDERIRKEQFMP